MMEKSGESTVDKRQRERERERWTYNKVYSGSSWYFFQRKIDTRVEYMVQESRIGTEAAIEVR